MIGVQKTFMKVIGFQNLEEECVFVLKLNEKPIKILMK